MLRQENASTENDARGFSKSVRPPGIQQAHDCQCCCFLSVQWCCSMGTAMSSVCHVSPCAESAGSRSDAPTLGGNVLTSGCPPHLYALPLFSNHPLAPVTWSTHALVQVLPYYMS